MLELRLLRSLVVLAEELHFGRAAERLHIVQPALTQQIQSLERLIGTPLFNRGRGGVSLTQAGTLVLAEARKAITQVERTEAIGRLAGRGEVGRLEVGYIGSAVVGDVMPSLVQRMRQTYPAIELVLSEMPVGQQLAAISAGKLDVGFVRLPPISLPREVTVQPLHAEGLMAALPAAHPLAALDTIPVERLAGEPMIQHHPSSGAELRFQVEELCGRHGFSPNVVQTVPQILLTIRLVATGLGVALVPKSTAWLTVDGVVYRPLGDDTNYELALAYRRQDASPTVRAFLTAAQQLHEDVNPA